LIECNKEKDDLEKTNKKARDDINAQKLTISNQQSELEKKNDEIKDHSTKHHLLTQKNSEMNKDQIKLNKELNHFKRKWENTNKEKGELDAQMLTVDEVMDDMKNELEMFRKK